MYHYAPAKAIALQKTPSAIIQAAVDSARSALGSDVAFGALAYGDSRFPIGFAAGTRDPRWNDIVVRPNTGLGGAVLGLRRPRTVADYATDSSISRDFVEIVAHGEGLRAVACVPVFGPSGIEALLYVGTHATGVLGARSVALLEHLGAFASVGLEQIRARELELELARLRERERLANQLHDSVAQRLFTIGTLAQAFRRPNDLASLIDTVEEIETTAAEARRELRDTLLQLHSDSDDLAFHVRLDGELRLIEGVTGCAVRVARHGTPKPIPQHIEQLLIDTAVEGTRNAAKHARARAVSVEIFYSPRRVTLVVKTQLAGVLSPPSAGTPTSGTGIGIYTLRKRAERLGGSLELIMATTGHAFLQLELPHNDVDSS